MLAKHHETEGEWLRKSYIENVILKIEHLNQGMNN